MSKPQNSTKPSALVSTEGLVRRTSWILLIIFFLAGSTSASEISSVAPTAPTNFQTPIRSGSIDGLHQLPSMQINSAGLDGKVQTLSSRGSSSQESQVSLEGIPLNLASDGYFNLGDLSWSGIDSINFIRGGYSPSGTKPSAQLQLSLPSEESFRTGLDFGSYNHFGVYQRAPHAQLSFQSSEDDFLFDNGQVFLRRSHNRRQNLNLEIWKKEKDYQIWGMLIHSQQQIPYDYEFNIAESDLETIRPLLAYQGRTDSWSWDFWSSFQNQANTQQSSTIINRVWSSGQRLKHWESWNDKLSSQNQLEFTQDHLENSSYSSETRLSLSHALGLFWLPLPGQLIHPRLRTEYVSDLKDSFSFHPGVGGRHELSDDLNLLWNFNYISRAPTLVDRFFQTQTIRANPDLQRQKSLQGDLGYEGFLADRSIKLTQAAFINRSSDLIRYDFSANQTRNMGTALAFGLENELNLRVSKTFELNSSYTYTHATQGDNDLLYQARHKASLIPSFRITDNWVWCLPVYARSSMSGFQRKLPEQWDLSSLWEIESGKWQASLKINNLLAWRRQEVEGFPLPQETWALFSVSRSY